MMILEGVKPGNTSARSDHFTASIPGKVGGSSGEHDSARAGAPSYRRSPSCSLELTHAIARAQRAWAERHAPHLLQGWVD